MGAARTKDRLIGTLLHGYRIEALIGAGSAAKVYRARHLFLDRCYAVKVLSQRAPGLEARFQREARALSQMNHQNIVSVVDFGTVSGRPFLTMELVRGRTLAAVMEERALDSSRVHRIARQIACGLAEAHRHGIIHRDLKPANVMLVQQAGRETVKILDFGIAREAATEAELTGGEVVLGTPRYMAPEQVMNPTSVSPASDLYSLGVMLYEMITGRVPFMGDMMEVLEQQMNRLPPPLTTQTGLELLVHRLLAKQPEDRLDDAAQLIDVLDRLQTEETDRRLAFADVTNVLYVSRERPTVRGVSLPTVIPDTILEDDTIPDDGTIDEQLTLLPQTQLALPRARLRTEGPAPTRLVVHDDTPTPTPFPAPAPSRLRRKDRSRMLAAVLTCIAVVLGFSVVALAAVTVQKRMSPDVIVVAPTPSEVINPLE